VPLATSEYFISRANLASFFDSRIDETVELTSSG
jgi:hypothetical protein